MKETNQQKAKTFEETLDQEELQMLIRLRRQQILPFMPGLRRVRFIKKPNRFSVAGNLLANLRSSKRCGKRNLKNAIRNVQPVGVVLSPSDGSLAFHSLVTYLRKELTASLDCSAAISGSNVTSATTIGIRATERKLNLLLHGKKPRR